MIKNSVKSIIVLGTLFILLILAGVAVLQMGCHIHNQGAHNATALLNVSQWSEMNMHYLRGPLSVFLLQIGTILIISKFVGYLFKKLGHPTVIGEIVAGIILGPSLFGKVYPKLWDVVFPPSSLSALQMLSQLGLILFIFVVGLELDVAKLKKSAFKAIVISHSSILVSLILGFGLAIGLYQFYSPPEISFLPFALFIGIALSITAFPVLVRIAQERGLANSSIGKLAVSCAAIDDISAWMMLSVAIAIVKAGSPGAAIPSIIFSTIYVATMFLIVRPLITKMSQKYAKQGSLKRNTFSILLVVMIGSAWATEVIGIHALFGAFLAGIACSGLEDSKAQIISKIEDLALFLLLPLFFAYSGLKTQIGLLASWGDWAICIIIIVTAVAGKLIGSGLGAKLTGESWKDSSIIAILMNARGLVELVVLNIGYDLGVINQTLFTMLVLMALTTTFMTGPMLTMIERISPSSPKPLPGK